MTSSRSSVWRSEPSNKASVRMLNATHEVAFFYAAVSLVVGLVIDGRWTTFIVFQP